MEERIAKTIKNLEKNNMAVELLPNSKAALERVRELIPEGSSVGVGGSVTLTETGILSLIMNGNYNFFNRYKKEITAQEIAEVYHNSAAADFYLSSSNAITEAGELYNVDGNSNRISAISYGPKNVIIVAGINKIVPDIKAAAARVRLIAAPKNTKRLGVETYCQKAGECVLAKSDALYEVGCGCNSENRICCNFLISAKQRQKNRIRVLLINEELGY